MNCTLSIFTNWHCFILPSNRILTNPFQFFFCTYLHIIFLSLYYFILSYLMSDTTLPQRSPNLSGGNKTLHISLRPLACWSFHLPSSLTKSVLHLLVHCSLPRYRMSASPLTHLLHSSSTLSIDTTRPHGILHTYLSPFEAFPIHPFLQSINYSLCHLTHFKDHLFLHRSFRWSPWIMYLHHLSEVRSALMCVHNS